MKYAKMGLPVFPCRPGRKEPLCGGGFHDATTDRDAIGRWWKENPQANIAMPTGAVSGLFVLDIDPRNGGQEGLADLVGRYGRIPETAESITGDGGRHLFIKHPGGHVPSSSGALAEGVDVKGDGGYVVMPPSVHPNGNSYTWELSGDIAEVPPAGPPSWLVELVGKDPEKTRQGRTWREFDGNPIPTGRRNNALTSLAGGMRRMGMSRDEIHAAIAKTNRVRCRPPLDDREVETIADSVARYAPDAVSVAVAENHFEQLYDDVDEQDEAQVRDPGMIPEHLFQVPGLVSEVMDFTLANAPYPNVGLAFCGAMSLQSFLCGRKVRTSTDLRPNIYLLALASSGTGKDFPRKVNSRVLFEIGHVAALGDKFASGQGIQDALIRSPAMLFQNDEMDGVLRQINFDRENRHESIPNVLLTLYTSANDVYPIRVKANQKEAVHIDQPHLTLFGTATPQYFYESLSQRMLTNGLFARMIIVDIGKRGKGQLPGSVHRLPEPILETANWWARFTPGKPAAGNLYAVHPRPEVVQFTTEAERALKQLQRTGEEEWDKAYDAGDETGQTAWSRTCENATRLALLYACSKDHQEPVIEPDAVRWATEFAMHQTKRQLYLASTYVAENPFHAMCLKLLRKLKNGGGRMGHSELLRLMHIKAADFRELIQTLMQQGQVRQITTPRRGSAKVEYEIL